MNLTFKGFLRGYCRELTGLDSDNLRKLLAATLSDAPSASEALMCFAASQGKAQYLARLARGTRLEEPYGVVADMLVYCESLEAFLQGESAPSRYNKVWLAYRSKKEATLADRRVISLMRDKTVAALASSNLTVYALCSQLGLNRGNVYAYLNAGDTTKVSRQTARRLMDAAMHS